VSSLPKAGGREGPNLAVFVEQNIFGALVLRRNPHRTWGAKQSSELDRPKPAWLAAFRRPVENLWKDSGGALQPFSLQQLASKTVQWKTCPSCGSVQQFFIALREKRLPLFPGAAEKDLPATGLVSYNTTAVRVRPAD